MPRVKVHYFVGLRQLLKNIREEEYEVQDGTRLMDLLLESIPQRHKEISMRWKEMIFEMEGNDVKFDEDRTPALGPYTVLINGTSYHWVLEGERHPALRYKLRDGDVIAILQPLSGG